MHKLLRLLVNHAFWYGVAAGLFLSAIVHVLFLMSFYAD